MTADHLYVVGEAEPAEELEAQRLEWRTQEDERRRVREHLRTSWAADAEEIVYYLRQPNAGLVKIGTTKRWRVRSGELARDYGRLQILLTHAGGLERERSIHARFGYLRVTGEWFRLEKELLDWVQAARGEPENAAALIDGTLSVRSLSRILPMYPISRGPGRYPSAGMLA